MNIINNIKKRKIRYFLFWFSLPAIILYAGFMVIPIISSFGYSFFTGAGLTPDKFVGFENYIKIFTEFPYKDRFINALGNNFLYYLVITVLQTIGGLTVAILVTRKFKGVKFFRRITYLPTTIAILVTGYLFKMLFSQRIGVIDKFLEMLHLGSFIRPWFGDPDTALYSIAIAATWQWMGIVILLFATGIDSISEDVLEAASIDGASGWSLTRHIILPLMVPVMRIVFMLSFIGNFTGFDMVFAVEGIDAGPNFSTDILGTLFYRSSFSAPSLGGWGIGMGSTVASLSFLIIGIGLVMIIFIFKRFEKE